MAPAGPWELAFIFGVGTYFFARKRDFFFWLFFAFWGGVFCFFGGDFAFFGVISRFWGRFRAMRPLIRAQRDFFFWFFFRGAVSKT